MPDLAAGLAVSIRETGLLIAYGAVILCFGSPLMAWATTRVDRRTLLAVTLALLAIGQVGSAFAPNYLAMLVLRLLMLAVAAIHTAGREYDRNDRLGKEAPANSFVFLGWSLSVAVALTVVTFLSAHFGGAPPGARLRRLCSILSDCRAGCVVHHSRSRAGRRLRVVARSFCC